MPMTRGPGGEVLLQMTRVRGLSAWLVRVIVVGLVATPLEAQSPTAVSADRVLIGMEAETGVFPVDEENVGMRLVIREVNDAGGVHGRALEVRGYPRAGGAAVDQAVANARRLVDEDGVFFLLNFGGPAAVGVAELAMAREVPHLFPHTALVTMDGGRYVFTSYPRYAGESLVMLEHLTETRGARRIGIVHAANIYGEYFRDRLGSQATRFGYAVAGAHALEERDPGDLSDAMAALRATRPDTVVMAVYPAQARRVMEAKAALAWDDVTMVSSGPLTDEQYLDVPGGAAEGTVGFCHYPDPNLAEAPGIEAYRALMRRYHPGHPMNRYSLYGYVFGRLALEGLERAGRDLTRERFVDAMESIREWDSGGILPPVSFSSTDHHAQPAGFICELRDGRFEAMSGWIEP
jgi:ABC-type branched-subunit amino acid transport system substrate-binding protein